MIFSYSFQIDIVVGPTKNKLWVIREKVSTIHEISS